jgi:hypothetical protein
MGIATSSLGGSPGSAGQSSKAEPKKRAGQKIA